LSLPAAIQKEKGRGAVPENILGSSVVPFSERLWWFGLASTFELLLDVSFLHASTLMAAARQGFGTGCEVQDLGKMPRCPHASERGPGLVALPAFVVRTEKLIP
jgi:hypothetical protein